MLTVQGGLNSGIDSRRGRDYLSKMRRAGNRAVVIAGYLGRLARSWQISDCISAESSRRVRWRVFGPSRRPSSVSSLLAMAQTQTLYTVVQAD